MGTCDYFSNSSKYSLLLLPQPKSPSSLVWSPSCKFAHQLDGFQSFPLVTAMEKPFRSFSITIWINTKLLSLALHGCPLPIAPTSLTLNLSSSPLSLLNCFQSPTWSRLLLPQRRFLLHSLPINPPAHIQSQHHFLKKHSDLPDEVITTSPL